MTISLTINNYNQNKIRPMDLEQGLKAWFLGFGFGPSYKMFRQVLLLSTVSV